MHTKIIKILITLVLTICLISCNAFFEKDNLPPPKPLMPFVAEISPKVMWSTGTGASENNDYLKMAPTINGDSIYTASTRGRVISINRFTSKLNWKVDLGIPISTGPGANEGVVVVASHKGDIVALQEQTGNALWQRQLPSEILAKPVISHGLIIIKSEDGYVRALTIADGSEVWSYQQIEPTLLLRGASTPRVRDNSLIVGFANGSLAKLSLTTGSQNWTQSVAIPTGAFAVQRMIDIDADPIIVNNRIYAATYQGKIASLDWYSGNINWSQDISSYTGMAVDDSNIYISDAKSSLWSFDANTGNINWRKDQLSYRWVTGPAVLGNYIIVGDQEGYLHWLNKSDGHMAARIKIGSRIVAAPLVSDGILYVLAKNGRLSAYTLG